MIYSTVTDFAKFLGWSTSVPLSNAVKYAINWSGREYTIGTSNGEQLGS